VGQVYKALPESYKHIIQLSLHATHQPSGHILEKDQGNAKSDETNCNFDRETNSKNVDLGYGFDNDTHGGTDQQEHNDDWTGNAKAQNENRSEFLQQVPGSPSRFESAKWGAI